jgi:tetratricopeptide (TPR) repeat protein
MATPRIEQLLQFYRDDPNDPFNCYAVALEYLKTDKSHAKRFFEILLDNFPDYIPTYYQAAGLYQELGLKEKAIIIYEKGIAVARIHDDKKAAAELRSALDELMF